MCVSVYIYKVAETERKKREKVINTKKIGKKFNKTLKEFDRKVYQRYYKIQLNKKKLGKIQGERWFISLNEPRLVECKKSLTKFVTFDPIFQGTRFCYQNSTFHFGTIFLRNLLLFSHLSFFCMRTQMMHATVGKWGRRFKKNRVAQF